MSKGHRSQDKKERNKTNKETRPHAHLRHVRISDIKARAVLREIIGKNVTEAQAILLYNPRYAAHLIKKLLDSAVANAENNLRLDTEALFVVEAHANKGSSYYSRWRLRPRARGSANRIERKVSHISIILGEKPSKR
ncbi:MAG: 50S ribosomal protein L22 [Defluviitaleaceae bacterium]|nr:50S ribosomal protein L22 [Defluviitaleaceae bacterium]MCL2836682.1 50S ribosomal protein L22 [Defluviitaleaceae bacterium]